MSWFVARRDNRGFLFLTSGSFSPLCHHHDDRELVVEVFGLSVVLSGFDLDFGLCGFLWERKASKFKDEGLIC